MIMGLGSVAISGWLQTGLRWLGRSARPGRWPCLAGRVRVALAGRRGRIVLALIIVARTPIQSFAGNHNQRKDESGAGLVGAGWGGPPLWPEMCLRGYLVMAGRHHDSFGLSVSAGYEAGYPG